MLTADFVALADEGEMIVIELVGEYDWIEDVFSILSRVADAVGALAILGWPVDGLPGDM